MTADWRLLDRDHRAMILAATQKIVQRGDHWVCSSQSDPGMKTYKVDPGEQSPHCTCPDFELRGCTCKHILAVRIVRQRELFPDGTEAVMQSMTVSETIVRKSYPQQWPAYNRAQVNEKDAFQSLLAALCEGIVETPQKGRGQRRIPMRDAVFACCFKVYSTLSARRFMSDLRDAHAKGHIGCVPHFNSIFNRLDDEGMTEVLRDLIVKSSLPLTAIECDFAADSTGFTASRFYRWYDHRYGGAGAVRKETDWVKTHLMIGVTTHVVTAVEIYERATNDSPILPTLLDATAKHFAVSEVSADRAYASEANFQAIAKHGATAFIPFREGTTGGIGGLFAKAFHYFSLHRDTFLQHYHKRSNVEACIMSIKTKFGDAVRSKTDLAMKNEVLCKILCHNLCVLIGAMHELGITPDFASAPVCTTSLKLAQQTA
jgi:transposase